MGNTIGKIFTIFLAVLLLFINPLFQTLQQQDSTTRLFVYTETTRLVDAVRNTGYLTARMYEEYLEKLSATNTVFSVNLEHQHRKYDPLYIDPQDPSSFENDFCINYSGYYTKEILASLYAEGGGTSQKYLFSQGDYFCIRIYNKNKTLATKVGQLIYGSTLPNGTIFVYYGGMIK